mmetsp:Transcript_5682/g.13018  ORF Transcript_5682/g.13018 Transcript_5682/m.13018 type:complete len:83 (+) Transcript_5682:438-686(+)
MRVLRAMNFIGVYSGDAINALTNWLRTSSAPAHAGFEGDEVVDDDEEEEAHLSLTNLKETCFLLRDPCIDEEPWHLDAESLR